MKLVLDTADMTDDFFADTRLLGMMTALKDYQFCWQLNKVMDMDFRINHEIEIQLSRKDRNYFFAVFEFHEPTGSLCHYIYRNGFDGEYLLPEFRHLDYLWLMKGDAVPDKALQETVRTIRTIPAVQLVVELTHEKIRNREHLVF